MIGRIAAGLWWMLTVFFLLACPAAAESCPVPEDYSDDLQAYAGAVASLNRERMLVLSTGSGSPASGAEEMHFTALLCKTDGREIDFAELSPSYIIAGPSHCFTLFFLKEDACRAAAESLRGRDGILYAEADSEVFAAGADTGETVPVFYSHGAARMNFGSYIRYTQTRGSGSAAVAVIDSGVFPHSLISGKLISGGYDYIDGDRDSMNDLYGHGTNVAGIIADCTGAAPVQIYPIRVLNAGGSGKMSNVVNAVREAAAKGVAVINLSLSSPVMSEALDDAILEAVSSGVIVVTAAGNESRNTSDFCPAHLTNPGVIVVGSAEESDGSTRRAPYSNYGPSVDIYAFGTDILCCSRSGGYTTETGTSMAAPHISALCGLMRLIHPELSPAQAESRLKQAAAAAGPVPVADAALMIPKTAGFRLSQIRMSVGDTLALPLTALPLSSCETFTFQSSDPQVVSCDNGLLCAKRAGSAAVTAACTGLDETVFQVTVSEDAGAGSLQLPETLTFLEDEAFYGLSFLGSAALPDAVRAVGDRVFDACPSLKWIRIPAGVSDIGSNTFSGAVVICPAESPALQYALDHEMQYILYDPEER